MLYGNRGHVSGVAIAEAIRLDREGKTDAIPGVYSGDFAVVTQDTPLGRTGAIENLCIPLLPLILRRAAACCA